MTKYYTSPYEKPYIPPERRRTNPQWVRRTSLGPDGELKRQWVEIKPMLRKHTSYPNSFSLTPRQREAAIDRAFDGAEILSMHGNLIIELGRETLRIAALNARWHIIDGAQFYVVKF